jgi:uncharacterized membrane protein HdeD (DUF308 family)
VTIQMRGPTATHHDARDAATSWLVLTVGLVSAAAGVVVAARPSQSLSTFALIVGILLLVNGIADLLMSLVLDTNKVLGALLAMVRIVVGLILIRHPMHGVTAIGLLIGLFLVGAGGMRLFGALVEPTHRLRRALIACIEVCAGAVIIAQPHLGYTALAIVVGVWLIANGIGMVALGLSIRTAHSDVQSGEAPVPEPASPPVQR